MAEEQEAGRKKGYGAEDIKVLEGLSAVRKRPAMYIGSTSSRGFHHLLWEVIDNSIDEALAGYAKNIEVVLNEDGSATVIDDGRGIPVDIHPKYNVPALEIVMTKLHAGGKFDTSTYKVSGGLHGVGVSVVNALSEWLEVKVKRDGKIYHMRFERGKKVKDMEVIGECKLEESGTEITFMPDREIFEIKEFDKEIVKSRLKELAYLTPSVKIRFKDLRSGEEKEYYFEEGIKALVEDLSKNKDRIMDVWYVKGKDKDVEVEVALTYTTEDREIIKSYVNNINTVEGGTHVHGFTMAISKSIRDYINKNNMIKQKVEITNEDIKEGVIAVVSVKVPQPQFEGQTKTKLGNSYVKSIVYGVVSTKLSEFLEENPKVARDIGERVIRAAMARVAAKKARELVKRKSSFDSFNLPGKLADCSSKRREETELFIVEGDSAGGSAKLARDRERQAILPLRGKIINVEKAHLVKVLKNEEIRTLITAIGTGIGEGFDISKLRYGKIIIMTDADVDGAHIRTLLLTFFYRYMPKLIEEGHVYIALPPLYKIQAGKEVRYAYSDEERDRIIKEFSEQGKKYSIQRYKGLGEMNPQQLWETTMDPSKRYLKKVEIKDAIEAEQVFSILMGEKVEPRREFILSNAKELRMEELDV